MDVDAVLARRPQVALVDELAHTNVPGSRNTKRWQDIEELLDGRASTSSPRSTSSTSSRSTTWSRRSPACRSARPCPTPSSAPPTRSSCEDMTAEALRRRLAHGNVYAAEKVDAALANYFRVGNLNALRELALLWTADRVDDALQQYREQHDITGIWEARERVVVALTGGPGGRDPDPTGGTDRRPRQRRRPARGPRRALRRPRRRQPGRSRRAAPARGVPRRQLPPGARRRRRRRPCSAFARAENATQLVLGDSRAADSGRAVLGGPGIGNHDHPAVRRHRRPHRPAPRRGRGTTLADVAGLPERTPRPGRLRAVDRAARS